MSDPICHGNSEYRGALEMPKMIQTRLDVIARRASHGLLEHLCKLCATRRHLEDPSVEQLIEEHRMIGNLANEKLALARDGQETLERGGPLIEQCEVSTAPTDSLQYG